MTYSAPTPRVLDELLPATCQVTEQYRNNLIEADHDRLNPDYSRCAVSNGCALPK